MSEREEPPEATQQSIGFTLRRNMADDPNIYGEAPDVVSACMLMAAAFTRSGYDLRVADDVGSTVAWIGPTG